MDWIWILIPLTALSIPIIAILTSSIEKIAKVQGQRDAQMSEEFMAELAAQMAGAEEERRALSERIAQLEASLAKNTGANEVRALPDADKTYAMPDFESQQDAQDREKVVRTLEKLDV